MSRVTGAKDAQSRIFERTEKVSDLEPILKDRLPISASIFNMCKNRDNWNEVTWYVLGGEISPDSWITATYTRDDYGFECSVSRPAEAPITPEIREAFSKASFIDWFKRFIFASVDTGISDLVSDISIREKGNYTHVHPANLHYMDIEDGVQLSDIFNHDDEVEVKSINNDQGNEFILKTWKYTLEGSDNYVKKVLERDHSSGVYVNGKIVSASLFAVHGLISMLYTLGGYRGKGYAQSNMHFIMKRTAERGLVPACTVSRRNDTANAFQAKIGFKLAGHVDYVIFENPSF